MNRSDIHVILLNDRAELNLRYRMQLLRDFEQRGWRVSSVGISDGLLRLTTLRRLFTPSRTSIVSSNLRANLVALSTPWLRGMVIMNGLGRYRRIRWFRRLLRTLIRLNRHKVVAAQSYADYRYLRRYVSPKRIAWIAGSGGTQRPWGDRAAYLAVQRDDKLPFVAHSLVRLASDAGLRDELVVVGCRNVASTESELRQAPVPVHNVGFVSQEALFSYGDVFLQPSGYGEGFPHTLADALSSGMPVIVDRHEYVRLGLRHLGARVHRRFGSGVTIEPSAELAAHVGVARVNAEYLSLFERWL